MLPSAEVVNPGIPLLSLTRDGVKQFSRQSDDGSMTDARIYAQWNIFLYFRVVLQRKLELIFGCCHAMIVMFV